MINFIFDDIEENPKADMCKCSICNWKGKTSDCETEWESEGWEYPEYQIHICPKCKDGGCIDNYWFSTKSKRRIK
jgi:hypothetical protein